MIIVSDTSPLSSLFLIGRLDLLPEIWYFCIVRYVKGERYVD